MNAGTESDRWFWQAMTSRTNLVGLAVVVLGVLVMAVCVRVMWRAGMERRRARRLLSADRDGTAVIEFALVFPIVMYLTLLLTQTVFLMSGNLYVHYAAYAGARAASVQVPRNDSADMGGAGSLQEDFNVMKMQDSADRAPRLGKMARVFNAACEAMVSVSGPMTESEAEGWVNAGARDYCDAIKAHFTAYDKPVPVWVDNLLPGRYRYAFSNTEVRMLHIKQLDPNVEFERDFPESEDGWYTFGPREPVTVEVTHRFYLSVPYTRFIFSDGNTSSEKYTTITAKYTLTNEGINPDLPPKPVLERSP